jgi:DegV family protein with EDD domain
MKEEQDKMRITVLPLVVNFGDEMYKDGVELSRQEFYDKLEKSQSLPTTSQINPAEFEEVYEKIINDGDEVLCILLASELSGTYQSAVIAANGIDSDKIHLVDSCTSTIGLSILLKEAVKLRDNGYSGKDIANHIEQLAKRVRLYAVIDTLKYLKMGGRLSATSAMIGSILGIHPIVKVQDGKVSAIGKSRSLKSGLAKLQECMEREPADFAYGFAYGHSNSEERLHKCMDYLKPYVGTDDIIIRNIGSVVGTHAGPGVVGIAYIAKE